jgi:hypothetical protein
MFGQPSIMTRIAIGMGAGFLLGFAGFLMVPYVLPNADPMLSWGFLLWYTTLGAVVVVFGVFDWRPTVSRLPPWWIRAPLVGAWMNFVLTLLIHHHLREFSMVLFGAEGFLTSPYWFVAEGLLVGLIIGYAAARLGGEGPGVAGR